MPRKSAPRYPVGVRLYPPAEDPGIAQRIAKAAAQAKMSSSAWLYAAAVAKMKDTT